MENRQHIIKQYVVPRWRLFLGSALNIMLYPLFIYIFYMVTTSIWGLLSGLPVEAPSGGFMSSYSRPAQNGYWIFVWSSVLAVIILSALLPSRIGASAGKYVLGIRYLTIGGSAIGLKQTMVKAAINIGYFLLLALPGPIIGFTLTKYERNHHSYDQGVYLVDYLSLAALLIGIVIVLILAFRRDASGRVLSYSCSGIVPIMKSQVESYKNAVKSAMH